MKLLHPIPGARVSQPFGANPVMYAQFGLAGHEGVDFAAAVGTPVRAAHNGRVRYSTGAVYGIQAWIEGDGITTLYAHLSKVGLAGNVQAGDVIGWSGNTGRSTGPHLHWGLKLQGVENAPYKNWLDPLPYLVEDDEEEGVTATMRSKLGIHTQKPEYPEWLVNHAAHSRATVHKLMDPDFGVAKPFGDVTYIGRLHWDNEPDKPLVYQGAAGADKWWAMAWPRIERCPWIEIWEGPNEPAIENETQARQLLAFEKRRVQLLRSKGRKAASYCFSTGCPELHLWAILGNIDTDYLDLHEYGMRTMTLDGWHLLRYRQVMAELRKRGYKVPPILITETGIDFEGNREADGWRAQGISEEEYLRQLAAYDAELAKDPEVVVATPFTWLDYNWPSFTITESMSWRLAEYMRAKNAAQGPTPPSKDGAVYDSKTLQPELDRVPATLKAAIERGYLFLLEKPGKDGQYLSYCYDPADKRYLALVCAPTPAGWRVLGSIPLAGAVTL